MEYKINISNNYMDFIQLPYELHKVKGFLSIGRMVNNDFNQMINREFFRICLVNYIFNMWDEDWYGQIISCNRNSVINEIAGKDGLEDLFLEILVKKSEIIFEKISFISFCFTNRNDRKFHSIGSFNPGDKYFYIRGKSTLIKDTIVELEIVFSGDLYACFDENSIIPISYKGNVIISEKEIININDEADKRCSLNFLGNDLTKLDVNNSISPFYNEQFKHKFFNLNQLATNSFEMSDIV